MKDEIEFPETLQEAISYFADETRALNFMVSLRWPDGKVICPHCQSERTTFLATQKRWKCKDCRKQFSAKVGTIFEDSALGYNKWFPAMWLIINAKNGISSYEIHRALGVTQKTGWFMLQRIRLALQQGSFMKFRGNVEIDETFIGGKARNMHAKVRKARVKGRGAVAMTPVQGLLQRKHKKGCSQVTVMPVSGRTKTILQANVHKHVAKGSNVYTDELLSYEGLSNDFTHQVINHAETYVRGKVHTNGMENFWSLLKRSIKGTYVSVEPFHLFRYLDEQAFRFNERKHKDGDKGRFLEGVKGVIGRGLKYVDLIGKGGDDLHSAGTWQTA
jgi:transposase-like protein